jgi:CP family cyanate transporter-like MFS transporter
MFIEAGLSSNMAGYILGCFTFFFTLSSAFFGTFSKSRDRRVWLIGSSQIVLVGLILMYFFPNGMPFLFIAIVAVGLGGAFTLAMTLPLDNTLEAGETNAWTAFVLTVGYLIAAVGPLLLGVIRDMTGSFQMPVLVLMGVTMGMILLGGTLKPKKLRFSDLYNRPQNQ